MAFGMWAVVSPIHTLQSVYTELHFDFLFESRVVKDKVR